jgi:hypothetical protein
MAPTAPSPPPCARWSPPNDPYAADRTVTVLSAQSRRTVCREWSRLLQSAESTSLARPADTTGRWIAHANTLVGSGHMLLTQAQLSAAGGL